LVEGDLVRYLGMDGVYADTVLLARGDTGIVVEVGKPSHHKDRTIYVRLFKRADVTIALPRGFWQLVTN